MSAVFFWWSQLGLPTCPGAQLAFRWHRMGWARKTEAAHLCCMFPSSSSMLDLACSLEYGRGAAKGGSSIVKAVLKPRLALCLLSHWPKPATASGRIGGHSEGIYREGEGSGSSCNLTVLESKARVAGEIRVCLARNEFRFSFCPSYRLYS